MGTCYKVTIKIGSPQSADYDTVVCAGTSTSVDWYYKGVLKATLTTGSPSQTVTLTGATIKGCDSTVTYTVHFADPCVLNKVEASVKCDSYDFPWKDGGANKKKTLVYTGSNPVTYDTILLAAGKRCDPYGAPSYKIRPTKCDSIYHLSVNIYRNTSQTLSPSVCGSYDWSFGGHSYNGTGKTKPSDGWVTAATANQDIPVALHDLPAGLHTYKAIVTNDDGCNDSVTLNLTIKDGGKSVSDETACREYDFRYDDPNGSGLTNIQKALFTRNTKGYQEITDTAIVDNVQGCDSLIILHLLLVGDDSTNIDTVVCISDDYFKFRGDTYRASDNGTPTNKKIIAAPAQSGTLYPLLSKACDSVFTFKVTEYSDAPNDHTNHQCCEASYTWIDGNTYSANGTYNYTADSVINGVCDQPYSITLTFKDKEFDTLRRVDCRDFTWTPWLGHDVAVSGPINVIDTINETHVNGAANGCDKVYTLCYTFIDTVFVDEKSACDIYTNWYANNYSSTFHYDTSSHATIPANAAAAGAPKHTGSTLTAPAAVSTWPVQTYCKEVDFLYLTIYPSYNGGLPQDTTPTGFYCGTYYWPRYSNGTTPDPQHVTYADVASGTGTYSTENRKTYRWTSASEAAVAAGKLANGCDSIRNLVLTTDVNIFDEIRTPLADAIADTHYHCDSVTIGILQAGDVHMAYEENSVLTENQAAQLKIKADKTSGIRILNVFDTIKNGSSTGCDSISHIIYKVIPNVYTDDTNKGCDSVYYSTTWYKTSTQLEKYGQRKVNTVCGGKCDSVFTISIIVNKSTKDTQTLYACDSANWGHTIYTWVSGSKAFSTADLVFKNDIHDYSVVDSLHRKNNCDSILYLDLTLYKQSAIDTIVEDTAWCHSFRWHLPNATYRDYIATGSVLSTTDRYTKVLDPLSSYRDPANFICDTTYKMNITVFPKVYDTTAMAGCDSVILPTDNYGFARKVFDKDTVTIPWAQHIAAHPLLQCDSLHSYIVTVNHGSRKNIDTVVCDSATFHTLAVGHANYKKDTTIRDTIHAWDINGCEVHDTISVHIVHNAYHDTVVATACDGYDWTGLLGPKHFTKDTIAEFRSPGVVHKSFTDAYGSYDKYCDTVNVLKLKINYSTFGDTIATACENFTWHYTLTTYDTDNYDHSTHLLKGLPPHNPIQHKIANGNTVGCDSTITLVLNFNFTSRAVDVQNVGVCDSFEWHGRKFYKDTIMPDGTFDTNYNSITGNFHDTTDINGCDSLTRLSLTMHYSSYRDYGTLTDCDTVYWDPLRRFLEEDRNTTDPKFGYIMHTIGSYDSTITIRFTANHTVSHPYSSAYVNPNGCDSVVKVKVVLWDKYVMPAVVENGCDSLIWHGKTYRNDFVSPADSLRDTLATVLHGCDSIVEVHPRILHASIDTVRDTAYGCPSYTWNPTWTTGSTTRSYNYIDELHLTQRDTVYGKNIAGCDSVFILVVNIYDTRRDSTDAKPVFDGPRNYFCDSAIWMPSANGKRHVITASGRYSDTIFGAFTPDGIPGVGSCDSIYIAEFNIRTSVVYDTNHNPITCESYTLPLNGKTYTHDTDFIVYSGYKVKSTAGNSLNCDSNFHMYLHVRHGTHATDRDTNCDQLTWTNSHGRWASTPAWDTTFNHTHAALATEFDTCIHRYDNAEGCASADTIYVVLYPTDTTSTLGIDTCPSYQWTVRRGAIMYIDTIFYHSIDTAINRTNNIFGCKHFDSISLKIRTNDTVAVDTIGCDQFTWMNGATYYKDTTGTETHYTGAKTPYGCDSIFTLNLHLFHTLNTTPPTITQCGDYEWTINGKNKERDGVYKIYSTSGTYKDTARSAESNYHCDSIVTLTLNITSLNIQPGYDDTIEVCEGSFPQSWTYMREGNTVTMSNIAKPVLSDDTLVFDQWASTTPSTCDTIARRLIKVKHNSSSIITIDTCYTYTWPATGLDYTSTGTYNKTITAANGCDSTITLDITFGEVSGTKDTQRVCDTYTWTHRDLSTETFTTKRYDTVVYDTTPVLGDCPFVDTLVLYRKFAIDNYDTVVDTGCNSYHWTISALGWDTNYTTQPSVASTKHIIARDYDAGCDSTVWLRLALAFDQPVTDNRGEVCDSLRWRNGNLYTYDVGSDTVKYSTPTHNIFGCDTIYTLKLLVSNSKYYNEGAKVVCDSLAWYVHDEGGDHYIRTFRLGDDGPYEHLADWTTTTRGCNVFYTVNVTVNESYNDTTTESKCLFYTWAYTGQTYTRDTTIRDTLTRLVNGCDSIHNLFLTIGNYDVYTTDTTVCDSLLFPLNDLVNGKWFNADSVARGSFPADTTDRSLRGLCDSIHVYNLTLHHTTYDTVDTLACDNYTWNYVPGITVNAVYDSNTYPASTTASGCDSIIKIRFTVVASAVKDSVVAHACDQFTLNFNGSISNYKYADYPTGLPRTEIGSIFNGDVNGCDSTFYLTITTMDTSSMRRDSTVEGCNPLVWHGNSYTSTVFDTITLGNINQHGCDSLVKVHVVVHGGTDGDDSVEVCATSYKWVNGIRYYSNISSSDPSAPHVRINNQYGCDSIVTLNLILNSPKSKDTLVDYACDSLTWTWGNGLFYDANTTAPYPSHVVSLGPGKCDSTTYLILVLKHSTHNIENTTACDSYTWHGQGPYTTTSTQTYDYINAEGCESTDTLHLTINNGTDSYDTVRACDNYTWNGRPFSADTLNDGMPHKYGKHFTSADPLCQHDDTLVLFMFKNTGNRLSDTACITYSWLRRNITDTTLSTSGIYYNHTYDNHPYSHFGHDSVWHCALTDTLDLTILNTSMRTNDVHACDNYQWTRTINGVDVINRTVTSVPAIGYVTQAYALTVGSYTCSGAETMRDTLDIVIGHNTALPTTRLDTACNYFDWWNEDMTEYAGHFTTSINDSTHHFTNASGCDSAVTLYLVINRGDTSGHVELACDEFVWNMIHYTADDTITDIHYDENGCVAIDTIYLTVNDRARTTVYDTACDTYTWDFNGQTYTTSQTITDTVPGSNGCDSIVTLHLTVNYHTNLRVDTTVCDAYTWHDQTYTASTIDTVGYYNNDGCPSRDTLHLTIRHNSNTLYTDTVCDSVRWHGMLLTTTDDHLYNYVSGEDCPSTDTLRLQVNRSVRFVESIFACDSLTWRDDSTYTASSDMVSLFHTTTPEGCDSSIWLSLTVKYSSEIPVPDSAKACDYYNWAVKTGYMGANGFVQTDLKVLNVNTTGVHKTEFCKNAAGCDSLRVLNLSLRYRDTADATAEGCGSYTYYSTQYTSNSQHDTVLTVFHKETRNYANRCDSVTRLHLTLHPVKDQNAPEYTTACDAYTWNGRTYRTSGNYESRDTTMYGCDSISTLILVLNHADSTQHDSAVVCDQTTWMGKIYRNTGIYRDTITTHEGCDSIRILYLTVHHRTHNRIDTTVCDFIYWPNDVTYDTISTTTYGVVTHLTYPYLYGCEQVDTLYLTVKNSTTIEFDSSVCDSVRWYSPTNRQGEWYKTSGDIRHTFLDKNSQNCDSSLLMHLTVHPTLLQVETLASCDSVMWHGAWLTTSQNVGLTYDSTYSDGRQCRVTDSLYFTRNGNNVYRQNESKFACDTFTWSRNAMTYAESGTYTDTLRNAAGCDSSIATLVLTIAYGNYDTLDTVSCLAPVEWNDSTYAVQGTYVIADTTPQGCPSLQILILHTGYYDTLDATSKCERHTWNGIEYTHEGYSLVADTHTTAFGCDSNTYLPLTIIKSQRTRIDTALFGPEYFWALHNKTYTQPGTYIDTIDYSLSMNCGRIDTLVLQLTNVPLPQILANTSHTIIMLNHYPDGEDGDRVDYEVYRWYMDGVLQNGKTSDVFNNRDWSSLNGHYYYLEVLYNNMWLRSNTVDLRTTGIDEATESIDFAIYPNPVISGRTLTMTLQGDNLDLHGATLTVFDLHGRDLLNTAVSGERTSLSADLPAGAYNLRLTLSDGRTAVKKLIVR